MHKLNTGAHENRDTFMDYLMQIPNFLLLFLVPISYLSISPALIEIGKDLNTATVNVNLIFTFFPAGVVAGQLTSVFYNRRFKRSSIILTCYVLLFIINILLFFSKHIAFFYVLSLLAGYLIGINYVQSTENILACKVKNKDRILTLMVTFYPMGALIAPLISSSFVKNNISWRYTYLVVAALIVLNATIYALISLRGQHKIIADTVQSVFHKEVFVNKKINLIYFITLLTASIYVVGEVVFGNWSPTYLRLAKGLDVQSAALAVTFFQIFIIIGRFIVSSIAGKIKARKILIFISCFAFVAIILFWLSNSKVYIYMVASLAGLGYSAMYPLLLSTGATLYEKGRGILSSMIFASTYLGMAVGPFITRKIGSFNLSFSVLFALIFSATATMLIIFVNFYEKNKMGKTDNNLENASGLKN